MGYPQTHSPFVLWQALTAVSFAVNPPRLPFAQFTSYKQAHTHFHTHKQYSSYTEEKNANTDPSYAPHSTQTPTGQMFSKKKKEELQTDSSWTGWKGGQEDG
ncbi:hypothetical protein V8G54_031681 [Vigna mungo]|uniref:Uncharacterized protein n=1 Tax=Vigna mungo TaxID=3915 RepID=A0AAQ3RH54_VIGMU